MMQATNPNAEKLEYVADQQECQRGPNGYNHISSSPQQHSYSSFRQRTLRRPNKKEFLPNECIAKCSISSQRANNPSCNWILSANSQLPVSTTLQALKHCICY